MGKIRVQDLAKMMAISNQDLIFKLKSIGVRVEGDDAAIDTDIIQAILQGKKLPHPREVILRDEQSPSGVDPARRRAAAAPPPPQIPSRRPPANPLRPQRPRTLIQKVEPRIQTLPMSERQAPASMYADYAEMAESAEMTPAMPSMPPLGGEPSLPAVAAATAGLSAPLEAPPSHAVEVTPQAPAVQVQAPAPAAPASPSIRRDVPSGPSARPSSPPPSSRPGAPGSARPGSSPSAPRYGQAGAGFPGGSS